MHRLASLVRVGLLVALLGLTLIGLVPSTVTARVVAVDQAGVAVDCDPNGNVCFYRVEGNVITVFPGTRIVAQQE
jgi:hypothetical protein